MGHQDKGHFAAKHRNCEVNEAVAQKIRSLAEKDCISCASAHQAAKALNLSPAEIGVQIDLQELRITDCQLGLFGYPDGLKRIDPKIVVSKEMNDEIDNAAYDGRISCFDCWALAARLKMKRLDMGSACEKKGVRIKPCQLGSF